MEWSGVWSGVEWSLVYSSVICGLEFGMKLKNTFYVINTNTMTIQLRKSKSNLTRVYNNNSAQPIFFELKML